MTNIKNTHRHLIMTRIKKSNGFLICFATGLIPLFYTMFLKISFTSITNIFLFIISVIGTVCVCVLILRKIYVTRKTLFAEFKVAFVIVVAFFIIFFTTSFLTLNFYFDCNYNEKNVKVKVVKQIDNFKLPVARTQYAYLDNEGNEHIVNHRYFTLFGREPEEVLTIKSGEGLFGIGYEDVYVMDLYPIERVLDLLDEI